MTNNTLSKILLISFFAVAKIFASEDVRYKMEMVTDRDAHIYFYQYGYTGTNLVFAVFENAPNRVPSRASVSATQGKDGLYVLSATLKDGEKKINLLKDGGFYESVNGVVEKKNIICTLFQLESFLKTKPEKITVDNLLKFIESDKKNSKFE